MELEATHRVSVHFPAIGGSSITAQITGEKSRAQSCLAALQKLIDEEKAKKATNASVATSSASNIPGIKPNSKLNTINLCNSADLFPDQDSFEKFFTQVSKNGLFDNIPGSSNNDESDVNSIPNAQGSPIIRTRTYLDASKDRSNISNNSILSFLRDKPLTSTPIQRSFLNDLSDRINSYSPVINTKDKDLIISEILTFTNKISNLTAINRKHLLARLEDSNGVLNQFINTLPYFTVQPPKRTHPPSSAGSGPAPAKKAPTLPAKTIPDEEYTPPNKTFDPAKPVEAKEFPNENKLMIYKTKDQMLSLPSEYAPILRSAITDALFEYILAEKPLWNELRTALESILPNNTHGSIVLTTNNKDTLPVFQELVDNLKIVNEKTKETEVFSAVKFDEGVKLLLTTLIPQNQNPKVFLTKSFYMLGSFHVNDWRFVRAYDNNDNRNNRAVIAVKKPVYEYIMKTCKGDLSLFTGRQKFEEYKRNSNQDSYARALARSVNNTIINTSANDRLNTIVQPGNFIPPISLDGGESMDTAEQTRHIANHNINQIAQMVNKAKNTMAVNRSDDTSENHAEDSQMDSGMNTQ